MDDDEKDDDDDDEDKVNRVQANQNAILGDGTRYHISLSFEVKHQKCDEVGKKSLRSSFKFIRNYLILYDCVSVWALQRSHHIVHMLVVKS